LEKERQWTSKKSTRVACYDWSYYCSKRSSQIVRWKNCNNDMTIHAWYQGEKNLHISFGIGPIKHTSLSISMDFSNRLNDLRRRPFIDYNYISFVVMCVWFDVFHVSIFLLACLRLKENRINMFHVLLRGLKQRLKLGWYFHPLLGFNGCELCRIGLRDPSMDIEWTFLVMMYQHWVIFFSYIYLCGSLWGRTSTKMNHNM